MTFPWRWINSPSLTSTMSPGEKLWVISPGPAGALGATGTIQGYHQTSNTVYSRYIAVVYIAESDISRSHVGPQFLATHFANFADMAPKSAIFCEIAVIPWTPYAGDSFSRNLLTVVAFDPAHRRQFSTKSALGQSGLPVKCRWEHMLCDGQPRKADHWYLHCITE